MRLFVDTFLELIRDFCCCFPGIQYSSIYTLPHSEETIQIQERVDAKSCHCDIVDKNFVVGRKQSFRIIIKTNLQRKADIPLDAIQVDLYIPKLCQIVTTVSKVPNTIGVYQVEFEARKSGMYIAQIFVGNANIQGSPFSVMIDAGDIDPSNCKLVGEGLNRNPVPVTTVRSIIIHTYDQFGNKRKRGGNSDKFTMLMDEKPYENFVIEDHGDGLYTCTYSLMKPGFHKLQILYNNVNISKFGVQKQDEITVCALEEKDMKSLTKFLESRRSKFEATLINGDTQEKVFLRITPTQIGVIKYKYFFFPSKVFTFPLRSSDLILEKNDDNKFRVTDRKYTEYVLSTKQRALLYAAYISFLYSKAGGSFDEKFSYFVSELRSIHNYKLGITTSNNIRKKKLTIIREQLLNSGIIAFRKFSEKDWRSKLIITFKNEPAIDAGGVYKEFMTLFANALINPRTGIFKPIAGEDSKLHLNEKSTDFKLIELAGKFVAKCLYDSVIYGPIYINTHFASSFYKQMLDLPLHYNDFQTDDPEFYKSKVKYILDSNMDDKEIREMLGDISFTEEEYIQSSEGGRRETVVYPLKDNGEKILVTNKNKIEYLHLLCKFRLQTKFSKQLAAFLKGFYSIIPEDLINIFDEKELELLLCGLPTISIDDFRKNVIYSGFDANCQTIRWFWIAVENLSTAELAKLLQFITGSSQVPMGGFAQLRIKIARKMEKDKLPVSHTCFNILDLPEYSSYENLQKSLLIAINYGNQGFGME